MTYPTLAVEVAFDDDPLDTTVSWTAITSSVLSIRTTIGRDTELDGFEPGTCTLVLDNSRRQFDPLYASGTYYGKLSAGKRVRVTATHSAVTYTLFVGWVDGWPQDYSSAAPTITVRCTDAFKQLARMVLPGSVYESSVVADAPWAWWRLRDQAGTDVQDSSGNGRTGTLNTLDWSEVERIPLPIAGNEDTVLALANMNRSTWYVTSDREAAPGTGDELTFEAWVQIDDVTGLTYCITALLSDYLGSGWGILAGQGDASYDRRVAVASSAFANLVRTNADVINDGSLLHLAVTVDGTTVVIYVDGVARATSTSGSLGSPPDVWQWKFPVVTATSGTGGTPLPVVRMGEVQLYGRVLTAGEILEHYQAATAPWDGHSTGERIDTALAIFSWPAGLKDIATGQTNLGIARLAGRNLLEYLKSVAAAEQGHLYCDPANSGKVTFRDRHHRLTTSRSTTVQYVLSDEDTVGVYHYDDLDLRYDESDIINVAEVGWQGGTVTVEDATSVTAYGRCSRKIDTELASRTEAENLGGWITGRYASPTARCRKVVLNAAAYQTAFLPALDLRIGDRVTVRKLPQGVGSAIEKDLLVEGVEHTIDRGINTWTTVIKTSEAEAGPWFVWGTATWDETTRWAW